MPNHSSIRSLLTLTIAVAALLSAVVHTSGDTSDVRDGAARANYIRLPLRFEAENGRPGGFAARGAGYAVSLSGGGAEIGRASCRERVLACV